MSKLFLLLALLITLTIPVGVYATHYTYNYTNCVYDLDNDAVTCATDVDDQNFHKNMCHQLIPELVTFSQQGGDPAGCELVQQEYQSANLRNQLNSVKTGGGTIPDDPYWDQYFANYPVVTDLCSNIDGTQTEIPTGYEDDNNDQVCDEIDLCDNLDGNQSTIPTGYEDDNNDQTCSPMPLDAVTAQNIVDNAIARSFALFISIALAYFIARAFVWKP